MSHISLESAESRLDIRLIIFVVFCSGRTRVGVNIMRINLLATFFSSN